LLVFSQGHIEKKQKNEKKKRKQRIRVNDTLVFILSSEVGEYVMAKLSPKQKAFADYYIKTGNATQSYIDAGYKASKRPVAEANARRLLGNDSVKNYIAERMAQKDKARIASQDEVLEFLTTVMRGEITEQVPIILMKEFEMVDKEPAVKDRTKAAELLGKRYALFKENHNHSGELDLNIHVDYGDDE
jgi:phage terminase small subunit